ncbi:MAG: hypothetical protein J6Z47_08865 [Bacteroidales bacterium]|nr:hypothetical protein [Bacteroidales bacterium]
MRRLILFLLAGLIPLSAYSQHSCQGDCRQGGCGEGQPKTVAILGDSYSTFQGYIPEGNGPGNGIHRAPGHCRRSSLVH